MIFAKIKSIISKINQISQKLDDLKVALGRIENRQTQIMHKENIDRDVEFKVFSQWGEDGIIQWLINNIEIPKKIFVEFGVQNYIESNTRFLLINNNWSGLVIDGSKENIDYIKQDDIYWRYNLKAECSFITAENINEIIAKNGITGEIGLLSVDIDGVDYWVWKAINCINPAIVICEYNSKFGKDKSVSIVYKSTFSRDKEQWPHIYWGASIKAFNLLAKEKGYSLVAGNKNGNNIFFVRNDLLNTKVQAKSIDDVFVYAQFREARDKNGKLAFYSKEQEQEILSKLELVNLE